MTADETHLVVRRSYVLQDALQRMCRVSFDPKKQVVVSVCNSFVGDDLYSNRRLNLWVKMASILGG